MTTTATSTQFQQNVGRYQDSAQRDPVIITKNGRPHTVLLSAHQFAVLTRGRVAGKTADMDDAQIEALMSAQMDPRHNHLNALLDED